MLAANNGQVLAYDNLSRLRSWLSDALCRLASGGGFGLRQLFTDENEILFHAIRPAILNGIEDVVCRADLTDRAVFLTLEPISDDRRRSEKELWREFENARPSILGALLDGAVHGLRKLPDISYATRKARAARKRRSPGAYQISSRKVAANGRFCAVGVGLRDGLLAAGYIHARL